MKTKLICNTKKQCAVRIKPNARIMAIIESEFRHLADYKSSQSLLKKYLDEVLFNIIKNRVTRYGSTLLDVILSGVENLDSKLGVYAPDGDAYKVFYELFDQIIADYHQTAKHPPTEYGFVDQISNVDHENKYMISIKISCNRSLCGYPFNRRLTAHNFEQIETRVSQDLLRMERDFRGTYHPLQEIRKEELDELFKEKYLPQHGKNKFMEEVIGRRCWPIGRGVFYTTAKNFFVWLNIEDHLNIMSLENGGDIGACYRRWVIGLRKIGRMVGFMYDARLGYLNFCPTNLGTGMKLSAVLKLYNLPKYENVFKGIASRYNLHIDVSCIDKCLSYIVSVVYKPKLGMNEFEAVRWMQHALLDIIRAEIHIVKQM